MNLLIDTNIVIPLEPGSILDEEINTEIAINFHNLATLSNNILCVHPAIEYDLGRDKDNARANIRRKLIKRYKCIPSPPDVAISSLTAIGVIEDTLRSGDPDAIARYVGSITVYRYDEICALCCKPILAIKFRFVKELDNPISLKQLKDNLIIKGPPQSISKIPQGKIECIKSLIEM